MAITINSSDVVNAKFNKWALQYGGRYDFEGGTSYVDVLAGIAYESIKFDVSLIDQELAGKEVSGAEIGFGYLQNANFGAHLVAGKGTHLIGIDISTVAWLIKLYSSCISNQSFGLFPDGLTKPQFFDTNSFLPLQELRSEQMPSGLPGFGIQLCSSMVVIAIRLLFHHELAHIWNGHADWLASTTADQNIREDVLYRSFEFDADMMAVWAVTRIETSFLRSKDNDSRTYFFVIADNFFPNATFEFQSYKLTCCLYLLFRLQVYLTPSNVSPGRRYPSWTIRLTWAMDYLFRIWSYNTNQLPYQVGLIISSAISLAEDAFLATVGGEHYELYSDDTLTQAMLERRESILSLRDYCSGLERTKRGSMISNYISKPNPNGGDLGKQSFLSFIPEDRRIPTSADLLLYNGDSSEFARISMVLSETNQKTTYSVPPQLAGYLCSNMISLHHAASAVIVADKYSLVDAWNTFSNQAVRVRKIVDSATKAISPLHHSVLTSFILTVNGVKFLDAAISTDGQLSSDLLNLSSPTAPRTASERLNNTVASDLFSFQIPDRLKDKLFLPTPTVTRQVAEDVFFVQPCVKRYIKFYGFFTFALLRMES